MTRVGHIQSAVPASFAERVRERIQGVIRGGRMGVRVRIRIAPLVGPGAASTPIETVAVVNSGFEANEPELIVPAALADRLGWQPLPPEARVAVYGAASGPFTVVRIPGAAEVTVVSPRGASPAKRATAVVSGLETEALISDFLASDLGLVLIDPRAGSGQIRDRLADPPFPSEQPERW